MVEGQRELERIPITIDAQRQIGFGRNGQFQHFPRGNDAEILQELYLLLDGQITLEYIWKQTTIK